MKSFFIFTILLSLNLYAQQDCDLFINPLNSSQYQSCSPAANDSVPFMIGNLGSGTFSGMVYIQKTLNAQMVVTDSIYLSSLPTSATYIAYTNFDLSSCQIHNIQLVLDVPCDTVPINDTASIQYISDCPPTSGVIGGNNIICSNGSDSLYLSGYNGTIEDWELSEDSGTTWQSTGVTNPYFNFTNPVSDTTLFQVILSSPYSICSAIDTTNVFTVEIFSAKSTLSDTINITAGSTTQLNITNGTDHSWNPDYNMNNINIANPMVWPDVDTLYTCIVYDSIYGCSDTAHFYINVVQAFASFSNHSESLNNIQQTLTPNGDGYLDYWHIEGLEEFRSVKLLIYNNLGQVVYSNRNYKNNWTGISNNGNLLSNGTYFYHLKFKENKEEKFYKGKLLISY